MITTPAAAQIEGLDTSSLSRQSRGLRHCAAILAVPMAVLATLSVAEYRAWAPLARDGVHAPAEVVGALRTLRASDRLRIAFATPDGRLIEASVPVGEVSRHSLGSTVEVAYDPANPRRVRTVEDWNPPYSLPIGVAGVLGVLALALMWRAWRWPKRLRRVASTATGGRPMVLTAVWVPGRVALPWAVLRERGSPPSAPPELAFRLADGGDAPVHPIEVDVMGEGRRRTVGVIRTPGGVIWPTGKLRRPPRNVRRAAERAPGARAGKPFTEPTDAGEALRALPPDFFTRKAQPAPTKMVLAVVATTFAVSVGFLLPEVVESHRHRWCPSVPAAAVGGAAGLIPVGAMASSLPTSLPGYMSSGEQERDLGSFANPPTVAALVNAGFTSGFARNFVAGRVKAKVEVFQFTTGVEPLRYEAQRLASLCALKHRGLRIPSGTGASGAIISQPDGGSLHRLTFVRGNRDYIVNVEGPGASGGAEILARLLQTAT